MEDLTEREMEVMMTVFRSFETGLREATIYPKVEHEIMNKLWLKLCQGHVKSKLEFDLV